MNHAFDKKLISLQSLNDWQQLRVDSGIKLEKSRNYELDKINITTFATNDNVFFLHITTDIPKITKKTVKFLLDRKHELGNDLTNAKYLVLMLQKDQDSQIVGVDLANRNNPKITTFHIDTKGIFNLDEDRIVYKNRTLIEQFEELKKDLAGGERELKVRYLKKFFEKQKLTEDFYAIYKVELFDKIKKDLTNKFGKSEEESINNFILLNLNRLLFIHFLDKKGGIFPDYDPKRGSYISYLFYDVYKSMGTEKPFYDVILKPLFFEVFNKSQYDRKIAHDPILFKEFYNLPYLNGGLFKESKYETGRNFFIDNVFVKSFITKVIDQFNFTITEDTPFDVKVSVDPELLGYIFENLIQDYDNSKDKAEDERSKGGIFYTPKIEVDFMCRQVLIEYLSKQEELKDLKSQFYELFYAERGSAEDQKYGSFTGHQIGHIFNYLEEIKVIDPACGSGAFLVGMMQVILDIENTLLIQNAPKLEMSKDILVKAIKDKTQFQRKKQLIKSSLHGVDIKPWAVEIAKLRLWLSMIVDIDSSVFQKDSIKTEALLPSFGFKVVQGDSLVNRIGTNLIPIDLSRKDILDKKMRDKIADLTQLKNDYYDNKNKDEYNVKKAEAEIYETILSNKITRLKGENTKLENAKNSKSDMYGMFGKPEFGGEFDTEKLDTKKIDKSIEENKSQIEMLTKQLQDITLHGQIPFARGIDFSEIFTEKGGFDIVIGNPPYVSYKAIEDPVGKVNTTEYKKYLKEIVVMDYSKGIIDINGKSDLYIYFYYKSLAILNSNGYMSFVTSNMWLDTQYGVPFQEFLSKNFDKVKIFDSSEQTFQSVDLNSIILFLGKPVLNKGFTTSLTFCTFKLNYENSIYTEYFEYLEKISNTRIEDDFSIIVDISGKDIYDLGTENNGQLIGKYNGGKWSNIFMRSRGKINEIIDKCSNKFCKINQVSYLNLLTGIKDGGFKNLLKKDSEYESLKILNNVKAHNEILINNHDSVLDDPKLMKKFQNKTANILWISGRGQTHKCHYNKNGYLFTGNYLGINCLKEDKIFDILLLFNSTLINLLTELGARNKGIGGAAIVINKMDLLTINIPNPDLFAFNINQFHNFLNRDIRSIFDELGFDKTKAIREQTPTPLSDRKELDDIIFDELGLTLEERNEVYRSLAELVKARLDKAKSV